jgi:hypothetical protein
MGTKKEEQKAVYDFAYNMARACDEIKSSHVYFIMQMAFDIDKKGNLVGMMSWDEMQAILTNILVFAKPKDK